MVFQRKRSTQSNIPKAYICPITKEVMVDPLMNRFGQSYERTAIVEWITSTKHGPYCPITKESLHMKDLIPNIKLRNEIRAWREMNDDMTNTTTTNYSDDTESTVRGEEVILAFHKIFQVDQLHQQQRQRKGMLFGRYIKGQC